MKNARTLMLFTWLLGSWIIAATAFCRPARSDRSRNPTAKTTLPIEIQMDVVFVPVEIAGHNLWFVLDSGSSRMLIDKARATALGLKTEGTDSLQGAGKGRVPMQFVHNVLIRLRGLESRYTTFSAVDLKSASEALGRSVDGILGFEFLSQFVVTVDYEKKILSIEAPEAFSQPPEAHRIPIEFHGQWPTVKAEMKIAEDVTIQDTFLVDSGSGDAVDHPVVKTMESKQETTSGVGLGTPVTGYLGRLWGFKLGAFSFRNVPVICGGATEQTSRLIGG